MYSGRRLSVYTVLCIDLNSTRPGVWPTTILDVGKERSVDDCRRSMILTSHYTFHLAFNTSQFSAFRVWINV